ncbi:T9SS type A sorting domain-containing protein, partial [bacterium]|nr:T9SS type A sorting domain-containing protein [bacterium]
LCMVTTANAQTWSTLNNNNSYNNRDEHAFVEVNGKFYMLGGAGAGALQVEEYNPSTNNWTRKGVTPDDFHHMQAVVYNGLIYIICVWEGPYARERDVANVWAYNPATDVWIQKMVIPSNRRRGSAGAVVYQNKIYIFGGNSGGHGVQGDCKAWVDVYDPNANGGLGSWTSLPNMPRSRDHFHAVLVNGKVYIIGGRDSGVQQIFFNVRPEIDVYDITANSWTTLPQSANMPTLRSGATITVRGDEIILLVGVGTWGVELTTSEAFNYVTNTWRSIPEPQRDRSGTQAIMFGNDLFLASGIKGGGQRNDMEKLTFSSIPTGTAPAITQQPSDLQVSLGTQTTFEVVASGTATITYQWESNQGSGWTAIPGATTNVYTTLPVTAAEDGDQFRVRVSNNFGALISATATLDVQCGGAFLEIGGQVVFEAENFSANIARNGKQWSNISYAGAIDDVVEAGPNTGVNILSNYATTSPELQYEISFSTPGTYYIWLRMYSRGATDDEIHGGLNGNESADSDKIIATAGLLTWHWTKTTSDGNDASVIVPTAGLHTLNLWMQEDGVLIDRILMTDDPSFTPADPGPSESSNCTPGSTFPVEITRIQATNDGPNNRIEWITSQEKNNAFFEIESSFDGQIWQQIGVVNGAGNSNTPISYTFLDRNPWEGKNYYHLRQVDIDGTYTYSDVVSATLTQTELRFKLSPNPTSGIFRLEYSRLNNVATLNVMTLDGKSVFYTSDEEEDRNTYRTLEIDLTGNPPGIYIMVLKTGEKYLSAKILLE